MSDQYRLGFSPSPGNVYPPIAHDGLDVNLSLAASWRNTLAGLRLLRNSVLGVLLLHLLGSLVDLFQVQVANLERAGLGAQELIGLGTLLFGFGAFVGCCMCLSVPYPPARRRAILGFSLGIATVLFGIALIAGLMRGEWDLGFDSLRAAIGGLLVVGIYMGAVACWMSFHMSLAEYFHDRRLRTLSLISMIVLLAMVPVTICVVALSFSSFAQEQEHMSVMQPVLAVVGLLANLAQDGSFLLVCYTSINVIRSGLRI